MTGQSQANVDEALERELRRVVSALEEREDSSAAGVPVDDELIGAAFRLGYALIRVGRAVQAQRVGEAVERLLERRGGQIRRPDAYVSARRLSGAAKSAAGEADEALRIFAELDRQFAGSSDFAVKRSVVWAVIGAGRLLKQQGDIAGAVDMFDRALIVATPGEPELVRPREDALRGKVDALIVSHAYDECLKIYEALIEVIEDDAAQSRPHALVDALSGMAWVFQRVGDEPAATRTYAQLAQRFEDSREPYVQRRVVRALSKAAWLLLSADDFAAAVGTVGRLEAAVRESEDPEILAELVDGLAWKAQALIQLERWREAIATDERIEDLAARVNLERTRVRVAWGLGNKGFALSRVGDLSAAIETSAAVAQRYGDDPALRLPVASALRQTSELLDAAGRFEESQAVATELVDFLASENDPKLEAVRQWAHETVQFGLS